jgi:hypothetical protein
MAYPNAPLFLVGLCGGFLAPMLQPDSQYNSGKYDCGQNINHPLHPLNPCFEKRHS